MRVTEYKMMIDSDRKNVLVKEGCTYCKQVDSLRSPEMIVQVMNEVVHAEELAEEHIWLLAMTVKGRLIGMFEIAHGTVDGCMTSPREIFTRACVCGAARIVLVHNHPSGEVIPSKPDDLMTQRIAEAGKIMNIQCLDHIIIGYRAYYSYAEEENEVLKGMETQNEKDR